MKWKNFFRSTIIKYIFSYVTILVTIVLGLYFIINYQLRQEYLRMYVQESQDQISNAADRISKGFLEIEKTNLALSSDINIISARYSSNTDYSRYQIIKELEKYCSRNIFSQDIIYLDRKKGVAYSTTRQCKISEDSINITMYGKNDTLIPKSYYDSEGSFNEIYAVSGGTGTQLLYSPQNYSEDFRVIYVLDQDEINSILDSCLSKGICGVELADLLGSTILSNGTDLSFDTSSTLHSSEDIFTLKINYPALMLHAVFDKNFLQSSTDAIFMNAYLMIGFLVVVGIIIIFFSMKMTYFPLYELKKQITNSKGHFTNDIILLNSTYQASEESNMFLKKNLNNYKTVIHQSILNSNIFFRRIPNAALDNIDKLFVSGNKLILSVVKILFTDPPEGDTIELILSHFNNAFTSFVLEADKKRVSLLIAWEDEKNKDELILNRPLKSLLYQIPCMIAFSNYSTNPLDIARLYSNATTAEGFLNFDCRIIGYDDISEYPDNYEKNYSYTLFDYFVSSLEQMDSENSFCLIKELFESLSLENDSEMFIRCILIDTTTVIGTYMSRNSVKYEKYSSVFTQTLDLCRKSNYHQTGKKILENFNTMLNILFSEASNSNISLAQIEAFVKENFCQPDFSITVLANHFNVSIAYMSFLFKKIFNINFSNYVWDLRYKKSQLLLSTTDYSIEKIGILVGYDNASSFRRKFKDEIGISPSQYRKDAKKVLQN